MIITHSLIQEKNNDISLYSGLFEKSPTVLREAIVTAPYSGVTTVVDIQKILWDEITLITELY